VPEAGVAALRSKTSLVAYRPPPRSAGPEFSQVKLPGDSEHEKLQAAFGEHRKPDTYISVYAPSVLRISHVPDCFGVAGQMPETLT